MIPRLPINVNAIDVRREVEEELQFHVDMCARDYESQGLATEEAGVLAQQRLGDVKAVKRQCVQIQMRVRMRVKAVSVLCATIFALGIMVRLFSNDYRVATTGTVLIMIALIGGLLAFVKTHSALHLVSDKKPLRLDLTQ